MLFNLFNASFTTITYGSYPRISILGSETLLICILHHVGSLLSYDREREHFDDLMVQDLQLALKQLGLPLIREGAPDKDLQSLW